MSEIRAALRAVPMYLLFGIFAAMVAFAIADLVYPPPKWAPVVYALLMFVPGLAAGVAIGGGWRRGLLAGILGAVATVLLLLLFDVLLFALIAGSRTLVMASWESLSLFSLLALASGAGGAAGGEVQARRGRQLAMVGSVISRVLGTDRPPPAKSRWLTILVWTVLLVAFVGVGFLQLLGTNLPPQVLEWTPAVAIGIAAIASAVAHWRTRKRAR